MCNLLETVFCVQTVFFPYTGKSLLIRENAMVFYSRVYKTITNTLHTLLAFLIVWLPVRAGRLCKLYSTLFRPGDEFMMAGAWSIMMLVNQVLTT